MIIIPNALRATASVLYGLLFAVWIWKYIKLSNDNPADRIKYEKLQMCAWAIYTAYLIWG